MNPGKVFRARHETTVFSGELAAQQYDLEKAVYDFGQNLLPALEVLTEQATEEGLLDDIEFERSTANVIFKQIEVGIKSAQDKGLKPDKSYLNTLLGFGTSAANIQRVQTLTHRTIKGIHDGLDPYGIRRKIKINHLAVGLDPDSRSILATEVLEEAVNVIDHHSQKSTDSQAGARKIDGYLRLADDIVPGHQVNPAQEQVRKAAHLVKDIMSGNGTTVTEVGDLARRAQRLVSSNNEGPALLPKEDVTQIQKLRVSLGRFTTHNPADARAISSIKAALIDIDSHKTEVTLPNIPSSQAASERGPVKIVHGGANDIRPIATSAQIQILDGGDKGQFSAWVPDRAAIARNAKRTAAGVAFTAVLAGTASPAAADSLHVSGISPLGNTVTPNGVATPFSQGFLTGQTFNMPIMLNTAPTPESVQSGIGSVETGTVQLPFAKSSAQTPEIAPTLHDSAQLPIAHFRAAEAKSTPKASSHLDGMLQIPDAAAPVSSGKSALSGPYTISEVQPLSGASAPDQLSQLSGLTSPQNQVGGLATRGATVQPLAVNNLNIDVPNIGAYQTQANTPVSVNLESAQRELDLTIASGGKLTDVAAAMKIVLQDQITGSGDTLTDNPDLSALYNSTVLAANNIQPSKDAAVRQAALAIVLSQHPELLADAGTVKLLQDACNTSNPVFTNAYMNWLNNQKGSPTNIPVSFDNTVQASMINRLLSSAMATNLGEAGQQTWLDHNDLVSAMQNRAKHAAVVLLPYVTQLPAASKPHAPVIQNPVVHTPAKPLAALPHPHSTATPARPNTAPNSANVSLQRLIAYGVPPEYAKLYVKYAVQYGLAPEFTAAQGKQESGWQPNVTSPDGAGGIGQEMPGTFREWAAKLGFPANASPYDPNYSIHVQTAMMADLINGFRQYADATHSVESIALAAYNLGPYAVQQANGRPTNIGNYATNILSIESQIRNIDITQSAAPNQEVAPAPSRGGEITTNAENHAEYVLRVPQGGVGHDVFYINQVQDLNGFDGINGYSACGLDALYTTWTSLNNNANLAMKDLHQGLINAGAYSDSAGILNTDKYLAYMQNVLGLQQSTIRYERNGFVTDNDLTAAYGALQQHKLIIAHTSNMVSISRAGQNGNATSGHYLVIYAGDKSKDNFLVSNVGAREDSPQGGKLVSRAQLMSWIDGLYVVSKK